MTIENFHFKAVKTTEARFTEVLGALQAADLPYTENLNDDGEVISIIRQAEKHDLPTIDVADLAASNPQFVADMVHALVVKTARKMFVDQYKPVGDITIADVISANTNAGRATVSTELLAAFVEFINQVMAAKNVKAGTVATVTALVKGKFNSQVLNKYLKSAEAFPVILESVVGYLEHAEPEQAEAFSPVCDLLVSNLTRWIESNNTETEELDIDAL